MTKPSLHPWLDSPEALRAARKAVKVPVYKMPSAARIVGEDELLSEALSILTECALPPRERAGSACAECGKPLESIRAGAKFCSRSHKEQHKKRRQRQGYDDNPALPAMPKTHIGSMYSWPEAERESYAIREVGLRLCHYIVTRPGRLEDANPGAVEHYGQQAETPYGLDPAKLYEAAETEEALRRFETLGEVPWDLLTNAQALALLDLEDRKAA